MKGKLIPEILAQLLHDKLVRPSRVQLFDERTLLERALGALEEVQRGRVSRDKVVVEVA